MPTKEERKARKLEKKLAKGKERTAEECVGPNCAKPVSRKERRFIKKSQKQKGPKKSKGTTGKILVKAQQETQQKSLSTSQTPGMDVSAHVLNPNIAKGPVITKKTVDVRDPFTTKTKKEGHYLSDVGSPTIEAEGDYDADFQRAKNIGMSSQGAQAFAGGGFKEEGPPETTTTGGLRRKYMEQGLYKKTKSGLKKQKSFQYTTTGEPGKRAHAEELLTQRGGRVKQYKSKEDMSREELKGKRKLTTSGTKYVSEAKIKRKKGRIERQMEGPGKGKKAKSPAQLRRQKAKKYQKTIDAESLAEFEGRLPR